MTGIIQVEQGIWILEEEKQNVLLKDCLRFKIEKQARKSLMDILSAVARYLMEGKSLEPLIQSRLIKRLTRQEDAVQENIWEVRAEGWGGRLVFIMKEPNSIVVAAVNKNAGSLSQTVNRGLKRWKNFLKEQRRFQLPRHWVST